MKRTILVVVWIVLIGMVGMAVLIGMGGVLNQLFRRSTPSKDEYIKKILPELSLDQIEKIDYAYVGAVGGSLSSARIEVKKLKDLEFIRKIPVKEKYEDLSSEDGELGLKRINNILTGCCGDGKVPPWLKMDLPPPIETRSVRSGRIIRHFYTSPGQRVFFMVAGED